MRVKLSFNYKNVPIEIELEQGDMKYLLDLNFIDHIPKLWRSIILQVDKCLAS